MAMRYHRLPPLMVMVLAFLLAGVYWRTWGATPARETHSLEWLALTINSPAHRQDKAMWLEYAQALAAAAKYAKAADVYEEVMRMDPASPNIRLGYAAALAKGRLGDKLYDFLEQVVYGKPAEVCDIFKRPEFQFYLSEARFNKLAKLAEALERD
jgi:cytochrome c-type biogenesis protein CcmH/NrfG